MSRPLARGPEIGWLGRDSIPEVQAFIDRHWRRGHILATDSELLAWQHRRTNGRPGLSIVAARDSDGQITGLLGAIDAPFRLGGEICEGAWLTTWVVPEEHRSSGVGLRLLGKVLRETDGVVATVGGNRTTMRLLGGLGFETCASVPRYVRIVSDDRLGGLLEAAGPDYPEGARAAWRKNSRVPLRGAQDLAAVSPWTEQLGKRWDATWKGSLGPTLPGTERDSRFLRWRYLEHPRFAYTVLFAVDPTGAEPRGLLVFRVQPVSGVEIPVVRVVELLADDEAAGQALLGRLEEEATAAEAAFIDCYATSAATGRALTGRDFIRDDRLEVGLPALFQPLDPRRNALTAALRLSPDRGRPDSPLLGPGLYLTRSDGDQDRPN